MRKWAALFFVTVGVIGAGGDRPLKAAEPAPAKDKRMVREILVPFEDLNVILEDQPRRVLLSREEYQQLKAAAKIEAEARPPSDAAILAADYQVVVQSGRAVITGELVLEVLRAGIHAVGLDLGGVGLRRATLDDAGAPIGRADDGRFELFVTGTGRHVLGLELVAPLETTAATQILNYRLPTPAATRLRLTVPGDVEVKSGTEAVSRQVDDAGAVTRFELVPRRGDVSLVMTLNSRLLRRERVVVARSVMVDEVTQAYERLHATFSMAVLHKAVDAFGFVVPDGFEVTHVQSAHMARWSIEQQDARRILRVHLREQTTETVVLSLSAIRTAPPLDAWSLPRLEPTEVEGQVAVVGLLVEDRLQAHSIATEGLIPVDTSVLTVALPASVFEATVDAPRVRPVVAGYAPQGRFSLSARFRRPETELSVTTNLLLTLADKGQEVRGGFALVPKVEKCFHFDFAAPAGWQVTTVTDAENKPLAIERFDRPEGGTRIYVRLPQGVAPGQEYRLYFQAAHEPAGWLEPWTKIETSFPAFTAVQVTRETGALAVAVRDDLTARPITIEQVEPLDEHEKEKYGLGGVPTLLAYRFDKPGRRATFTVERVTPRLTARTFSFFVVQPDVLVAHYELVYEVEEAGTRELALLLPGSTPESLAIRGLGDARLKEYSSRVVDGQRRWSALLAEPRRGAVRLAVDFQQPLTEQEPKNLPLPIVRADGVSYQSGLVAVEGSAELNVEVKTDLRKADVGELIDAEYQPGTRLLGAHRFVGDRPAITVSVFRHPGHRLPPVIVQRAELATLLDAHGLAQTAARFALRTKAQFMEVELPAGSTLWSMEVDGNPATPQRDGAVLLISLPAAAEGALRDLRVVYETPVSGVALARTLDVPAPKLRLRGEAGGPGVEIPVADLAWYLQTPSGFEVVSTGGTVVTEQVQPPALALGSVARWLYCASGGVHWFYGVARVRARELSKATEARLAAKLNAASELAEEEYGEAGAKGFATFAGVPADRLHLEWEGEDAADVSKTARTSIPKAIKLVNARASDLATTLNDMIRRSKRVDRKTGTYPIIVTANDATNTLVVTANEKDMAQVEALIAQLDRPLTPAKVPGGPPVAAPAVATPSTEPPADRPADVIKAGTAVWALEGVRSLKIDLQQAGEQIAFYSLGGEPRLVVSMTHFRRSCSLAWTLAGIVALVGLLMLNRPIRTRAGFVVAVVAAATILPLITGSAVLTQVVNPSCYVACLLVPAYAVISLARWLACRVRMLARAGPAVPAPGAALTVAVALLCLCAPASIVRAEGNDDPMIRALVDRLKPPPPVAVPADAIIVPYDPTSKTGIRDAHQLFVPYEQFVELWNLAHPDQRIQTDKPPASYALAGAAYAATLQGEEYLLVEGTIELETYTDEAVSIPLGLEGGVLARADLDGKPARLGVARMMEPPAPQGAKVKPAALDRTAAPAVLLLHVTQRGRHRLEVAVRMKLERPGGWRVAQGRLPAAAATALNLTAPQAQTEVRIGHVADRRSLLTTGAGEVIATALGVAGAVDIRWRPKVGEGAVDRSLTAESAVWFDVQEDGLGLDWTVRLTFRRSEREFFTLGLPPDYLVLRVSGGNVRGWETREVDGRREIEVSLLKPAKDQEEITLHLWRRGEVGGPAMSTFDVPIVTVPGAALHQGQVAIRRSPLLNVRTTQVSGVARTDLPPAPSSQPAESSPLGIRPYQAYQFAGTPFTIHLEAEPVRARTAARLQTILRIAERERSLETKIILNVGDRPLHHVRVALPADLDIDKVSAPGVFEWAVTQDDGGPVLSIYLARGQQGEVPVLVTGTLGKPGPVEQAALPRLAVLDVAEQEGDIVVQGDPAYRIETRELVNCETVLLTHVYGWLTGEQRPLARLALRYRGTDYRGTLRLVVQQPDVSCYTVTNLRVTGRAIEETVLLDFTIRNAGVREVVFLLPVRLKDARINVPQLRQKTIEPASNEPGAPVRVRLELQDKVMGQLRVLVESDCLLTPDIQDAPIPVVETGRMTRRYILLESAGRDEVVVESSPGLDRLSREQQEWKWLASVLGGAVTEAYIIQQDAQRPGLTFRTRDRAIVETAGAWIGLAETLMVVDASGTYRAVQVLRVQNTTEQYLEVEMPADAVLWTVRVAGEPVKPTQAPDPGRPRHVRIPLVKTAAGDLDYEVILKYGGQLPALGVSPAVSFPMVRTVNINVALSQVRLYLPETHDWFDFDGTMRRTDNEAELGASYVAYQTRVAERLAQTLGSADDYAKVRAVENLKVLNSQIDEWRRYNDPIVGDATVQAELQSNALIIQGAGEQVRQIEEELGRLAETDNRSGLNRYFVGQRNSRSRNVVKDIGSNFGLAVQPQPAAATHPAAQMPPTETQLFDGRWFFDNGLVTVPAQEATVTGVAVDRDAVSAALLGRARSSRGVANIVSDLEAAQQQDIDDALPQAPNIAGGEDLKKLQESHAMQWNVTLGKRADAQAGRDESAVTRYQDALRAQRGREKQDVSYGFQVRGMPRHGGQTTEGGGMMGGMGGFGGRGYGGGSAGGAGQAPGGQPTPAEAAAGRPVLPAGLASLDVEIPVRGRAYFFTTPRGEVKITARAVSRRFVANVEYLIAVLVVLGVGGQTCRVLRRHRLIEQHSRGLATTAIVLGLVALVIGCLPVAAAVVALIGLRVRIALRYRQPAAMAV